MQQNMESSKQIECGICLSTTTIQKIITLSCNHRFCKECLVEDWTDKIKRNLTSHFKLICPQDKCKRPINYYELQANLPFATYESYLKKTHDSYKTETNSSEIFVICPNIKCKAEYFICRQASFFFCKQCERKSCADCLGDMIDHEGIKCEEFQEKISSPEEYAFRKTFIGKQCPVCKLNTEKISGCNFMTCPSKICQEKKFFCYLCGIELQKNQSSSHFNGKPYGNICMTSIKKQENKKMNEKACPSCGTKDPDICEVNINFPQICLCKKCKGKTFCLKCQKEISANDEMIMNHLHSE